jgi:phosphate transport system permease protein
VVTQTSSLRLADRPAPVPIAVRNDRRTGDKVFRGVARATAYGTLVLLFLIGLFLLIYGFPAFHIAGFRFFTTSGFSTVGKVKHFGVAASLYGTVVVAVVALVVGAPIGIVTALFLTEYCPRRLRPSLISVIDLAAAIPSVIYGFWALAELQTNVVGVTGWISRHLSWIPIFHVTTPTVQDSLFMAGIVVGIMIIPIVASVSREVFSLTPPGEKEAALALGGTRAAMIRRVVLPFGRGGMIGAVMLGLGRALGETIAVAIILSESFFISPHILQTGGSTVAAFIALHFGSGGKLGTQALLFAGLVLFAMTLVINLLASEIVARSRSGSGVEL